MKTCPHCQQAIHDSATACQHCGKAVGAALKAQQVLAIAFLICAALVTGFVIYAYS